jgi:hypothetical protein
MTIPKVETTYVAGDRWYVDPGTGDKVPGVSAVLGMMPKPALTRWAAKEAAWFAVSNLDTIAALARTDREAAVELVKGAPWRRSGKAADVGTEVHGLTERLMRDRMAGRKSDFRVPVGAMPFLRNFARFVAEFEVSPVLVETTIWNDVVGYAGTFDGVYDMTIDGARIRCMVDTKTGESGVWPEASLQQTAYVRAPWYLDPDTGERKPMLDVERAFGLWLRPEGWALIPLSTSDENWRQFVRLRESYEWKRAQEKYAVGKAINEIPHKRVWKGNR